MPSLLRQSRKNASERAAAQAWDYLAAAVAAAGDSARNAAGSAGETATWVGRTAGKRGSKLVAETGKRGSQLAAEAGKRGSQLAAGTGGKVSSSADEAWRRANAAVDALAGRRASTPWGLLIVAGVAGVAIGFAAAATLRTAVNRTTGPAEFEPAPPPTTEQVHFDA